MAAADGRPQHPYADGVEANLGSEHGLSWGCDGDQTREQPVGAVQADREHPRYQLQRLDLQDGKLVLAGKSSGDAAPVRAMLSMGEAGRSIAVTI